MMAVTNTSQCLTVYDEPVYDEPVYDEPVYDEPVTDNYERNLSTYVKSAVSLTSKIAVPILMLMALDNLPRAEGGPITYGLCYASCNAAVAAGTLTPAGIVLCFNACFPLLGPWCP